VKRETIKAKGFQEHRTFEGKAFEERGMFNIQGTGCKPSPAKETQPCIKKASQKRGFFVTNFIRFRSVMLSSLK